MKHYIGFYIDMDGVKVKVVKDQDLTNIIKYPTYSAIEVMNFEGQVMETYQFHRTTK